MDDITVRRHVLDELEYAPMVDAAQIGVAVDDGCVTLEGCVPHYHQKAAVDKSLRRLAGVTDIVNLIAVKPPVQPTEVKDRILAALRRSARDPDTIRVHVDGDKVILDGCVDVWSERKLAERAAWSAPGVRAVEDRLTLA